MRQKYRLRYKRPLNRWASRAVIRVVGSMRGTSLPRRSASAIAGAALLIASGSIHLDLYLTGYRSIPTIGWLYLLQGISAYALGTLVGYLLSLKVGLFGFTEVRTTAGIVAAIIDVAAFAVLAPAVLAPAVGHGRRTASTTTATAAVSVLALALLGAAVATPKAAPAASVTAGSQALKARKISGVTVLTNAKGLTLYSFAPDTPAKSACYGSCAAYWPPVPVNAAAGPGVTGQLGTIKRTDGSTQATYDGHPLYTYIGDSAPGKDSGNNLNLNGGLWRDVPAG